MEPIVRRGARCAPAGVQRTPLHMIKVLRFVRYTVKACRASLKTHRTESGEKVFRQSKQRSARIADPMRRIFVTNDGKDSADSPCEGFLEVA